MSTESWNNWEAGNVSDEMKFLEAARKAAVEMQYRAEDKLSAARKALIAIAANKSCECAGCVCVRAIVAFMETP